MLLTTQKHRKTSIGHITIRKSRDTRPSLEHPAGQTGVHELLFLETQTEKGIFLPGQRPGVPGTPGHPGGASEPLCDFPLCLFCSQKSDLKVTHHRVNPSDFKVSQACFESISGHGGVSLPESLLGHLNYVSVFLDSLEHLHFTTQVGHIVLDASLYCSGWQLHSLAGFHSLSLLGGCLTRLVITAGLLYRAGAETTPNLRENFRHSLRTICS